MNGIYELLRLDMNQLWVFVSIVSIQTLIPVTFSRMPDIVHSTDLSDLTAVGSIRCGLVNHIKFTEEVIEILDNWALMKVSNITNSTSLDRKIIDFIQQLIINMEPDMEQLLLESSLIVNDTTILKEKYHLLQEKLDYFKKQLDGKATESLLLLQKYSPNSFPNFTEILNNFYNKTAIIHKNIATLDQTILTNEAVEALENGEYNKSVSKLHIMNEEESINNVVNKLYSSNLNNIYKVFALANRVGNVTKRLFLYKQLYKEMSDHNHLQDSNTGVILYFMLSLQCIQIKHGSHKIKNEILKLENMLWKIMKTIAKKTVISKTLDYRSHIIITNGYDENGNFHHGAFSYLYDSNLRGIFQLDFKLFAELCLDIHEELLKEFKEESKLVNHILFDIFIALTVENKGRSDIELGLLFKYLHSNCKEKHLKKLVVKMLSTLENEWPPSIKNIVNAKEVCIENFMLNNYLHRTKKSLPDKFGVNLSSKTKTHLYKWKLVHFKNNLFNIVSIDDNHTYLSTYKYEAIENFGHVVIVTRHKAEVPEEGFWKIFPSGISSTIMNVKHEQFLYATKENDNAFVGNVYGAQFFNDWYIEDCT